MQITPLYGDSVTEIISAINGASTKNPSLGILFCSSSLGIEDLACELSHISTPFIGSTTAGEILSTRIESPISELSATGCLIEINPAWYITRLFEREEKSCTDLGESIGRWGQEFCTDPIFIILISGLTNNGEEIVRGIEAGCRKSPGIYGGVAADDGMFEETLVFANGISSSDGVAVIVFDGSVIKASGLVTSGWRGVGVERIITSSCGNRVYTIDDIPALDFFSQYLNLTDNDIPGLSVEFPLIVLRDDGTSVIRATLAIDRETKAVIFAGSVPEGSRVRFSQSSGHETIHNAIAEISAFSEEIQAADLLLLFSCMARHQAVGQLVADEIRAASEAGSAPLVGFFSYGEIGMSDICTGELFNETYSLLALSERRE
ncbi:MAG TPA: FIST N-terminal domain-containing protein [Methanospirillum sp.]|nr:FIST N-terminal domain-containing protein [Methanospirillum sp.]